MCPVRLRHLPRGRRGLVMVAAVLVSWKNVRSCRQPVAIAHDSRRGSSTAAAAGATKEAEEADYPHVR